VGFSWKLISKSTDLYYSHDGALTEILILRLRQGI
jgi:hypothetical protein